MTVVYIHGHVCVSSDEIEINCTVYHRALGCEKEFVSDRRLHTRQGKREMHTSTNSPVVIQ